MRNRWLIIIIPVLLIVFVSGGWTYDEIVYQKSLIRIDPFNCEIIKINPETDTSVYTGEYHKECLEFQELPMAEQIRISRENPEVMRWRP